MWLGAAGTTALRYEALRPSKGLGASEMNEGRTIRDIRAAVADARLSEPFGPAQVNAAVGIDYARVFLPKHRVGNPGGNSELFVRVSRRPALYRLYA